MNYHDFLRSKQFKQPDSGFDPFPVASPLFDFQADLTRWAIRRGRAAVFADTGLGKTRIQIEWGSQVAAKTGRPVLILAPLAVAAQTVNEARSCGVPAVESKDGRFLDPATLVVTNYERLHKFETHRFGGVVLDESSILKSYDGKTRSELIRTFSATPYRLACTATPAPNDHSELGNHAEFLGICSRVEMLAEFFVHDGGDTSSWRLKGHAQTPFWRWLSSWAATLRRPSDLGYDDGAFLLPPLTIRQHVVESGPEDAGLLFALNALTLLEQRQARRSSLSERVALASKLANGSPDPWVVWCDLNAESAALAATIHGAVEVRGDMEIEEKERRLADFASGRSRVIVTKPSIAGYGLNWQHAAHMAFVGVTHSFESFYQAVRRCWRFGQSRPVECHVITSEAEGEVVANLRRKEALAAQMHEAMAEHVRAFVMDEVRGHKSSRVAYQPRQTMRIPEWLQAA